MPVEAEFAPKDEPFQEERYPCFEHNHSDQANAPLSLFSIVNEPSKCPLS